MDAAFNGELCVGQCRFVCFVLNHPVFGSAKQSRMGQQPIT